jgi:hypothetical protein
VSARAPRIAVGLIALAAAVALLAADAGAAISLAPGVAYPCASCTRDVQVADLARAGKLALVLPAQASGVAVLRGSGDGRFAAPEYLPTSHIVYATAVGDVNGDGAPDIVAAMGDAAEVQVFVNHADGSGTFALPVVSPLPVGCDAPRALTVADLNGDGSDDVAVGAECDISGNGTGYCCGSIAVLLSSGGALTPATGGTLCKPSGSTASCYDDGGIYGSVTWLGASRLTGGAEDLIAIDGACGFDPGNVKVFAGNGNGSFQAGKGPTGSNVACPANEGALADLNGDGLQDVLLAGAGPDHNCYNDGDCVDLDFLAGDGATNLAQAVPTTTDHLREKPPVAVDLDGDGNRDVATPECCANGDILQIYAGHGDGTFAAAQPVNGAGVGSGPLYTAAGDLNHDGRPDVVVAYTGTVSVYLNTSAYAGSPNCPIDVTNLVCDGGFEDPAISGPYATYGGGGHFGPWQVDGAGVDLERDVTPASGSQSLDLNAGAPGSVSQLLATAPGAAYTLQFSYAANPACGDRAMHFDVTWNGVAVAQLDASSAGHTAGAEGWQPSPVYTLPVSPLNPSRLGFASTAPAGPCGPMLDDVRVAPAGAPGVTPTPTPPPLPTGDGPFAACRGNGAPNPLILAVEVTQGVQTTAFPDRAEGCAGSPGRSGLHPAASYPSGPLMTGQDVNYVGLVAGKSTLVRVYADIQGSRARLPSVWAYLYAYRRGKPLGSSYTAPNPQITFGALAPGASLVSYDERVLHSGSFDFVIPDAWTDGTVDLVAEIRPGTPSAPNECAGCAVDDVFTLRGLTFNDTQTMQIATAALETPGLTIAPARDVLPALAHLLPVSDRRLSFPTNRYGASVALPKDQACDGLPQVQAWRRGLHLKGAVTRAVGILAGNAYIKGGFCQAGHTSPSASTAGAFGSVDYPPSSEPLSAASALRPLTSVTHEVFHGLSLPHAGGLCGGGANNLGAQWPPDDRGFLQGIGTDFRELSGGGYRIIAPTSPFPDPQGQFYDLMSYCIGNRIGGTTPIEQLPLDRVVSVFEHFTWESPRAWDVLLRRLAAPSAHLANAGAVRAGSRARVAAVGAGATAAPRARVRAAAAAGGAGLRVVASLSGAGVTIDSVEPDRGPAAPAGTSDYALVARDAGGRELASAAMALEGVHSHSGEESALLSGAVADANADAASVEIVHGGEVVAHRARSAHAPVVAILAPARRSRVRDPLVVRWSASDSDRDALTTTVDVSSDNGRTWVTQWIGPDAGRVTLPGGPRAARARVRVRVNDGFNETVATSAAFRALGAPAAVEIHAPLTGQHVQAAESLRLAGAAYAADGTRVAARALTWMVNGRRLARGETVSVAALPPGRDTLELRSRDGGRARVVIHVAASPPQLFVLRAPARVPARARSIVLRVAAVVPARLVVTGAGVTRMVAAVSRAVRTVRVRARPGRTTLHLTLTARAGRERTRTLVAVAR